MGAFNRINLWNKTWILTTVVSLLLYDLYWIRGVFTTIYVRFLETWPDVTAKYPNIYIDHFAGGIANILRLIGVILVFIAFYLSWGPKKQSFTAVRKYIAIFILFEALYWLAILPYNIVNVARGRTPLLLFVGFDIQILIAAPLLLILGAKVWKYKEDARSTLIKWACITGIGYIVGMWINNLFRWFSMSSIFGAVDPRIAVDLFSGITVLGFLNTAITLPISIAFAIAGSNILIKRNNKKLTLQLIGIAILLFGLHFALYAIYCWFAPNAWRFILLTEIWPLPLVGLGIGLLKGKI